MGILLLNNEEVAQAITMSEAIETTATIFSRMAKNKVNMPAREVIALKKNNLALFSPAYSSVDNVVGVKFGSIFPKNKVDGLPMVQSWVALLDSNTGKLKMLMSAEFLTTIKTGSLSGLATSLFAKPEASSVAIIGLGAQAQKQLEAVCHVRNIKEIYLYSRDYHVTKDFKKTIKSTICFSKKIFATKTIREATKAADIICTITSTNSAIPLINLNDVKEGVHINALGGRTANACEIGLDIIENSYVVVESKASAISEAGEIISGLKYKKISLNSLVELGEFITNRKFKRVCSKQITCFKSVGLSIQDVVLAEKVFHNAKLQQLGRTWDL